MARTIQTGKSSKKGKQAMGNQPSSQNIPNNAILLNPKSFPEWLYCSEYSVMDGHLYNPLTEGILATKPQDFPDSLEHRDAALNDHLKRREHESRPGPKPWNKSSLISLHSDKRKADGDIVKLRLSKKGEAHGDFILEGGQLLQGRSPKKNMKVWRISGKELKKQKVKLFDVHLMLEMGVFDGQLEHARMFDEHEFWAWGPVPMEAVVDSTNYTAIREERMRELGFRDDIPQTAGVGGSRRGLQADIALSGGINRLEPDDEDLSDENEDQGRENQRSHTAAAQPPEPMKLRSGHTVSRDMAVKKPKRVLTEEELEKLGYYIIEKILGWQWADDSSGRPLRDENGNDFLEYNIKWGGEHAGSPDSWLPEEWVTDVALKGYWDGKQKPKERPQGGA